MHAVITIPAYYFQIEATVEAAWLAGLKVLGLLSEHLAAAIACVMDKKYEIQGTILVYDLDGGTFGVSTLKVEGCIIEVLSTNGNLHLGGDPLLNLVIAEFKEKHGKFVLDGTDTERTTSHQV